MLILCLYLYYNMTNNLQDFIALLEKNGELLRLNARVDSVLEIAEITDRVSKSPDGGKALLFTDTGTDFPVLTNMMGSDRRMALALGVESLDGIGVRIRELGAKVLSPKNGLGDKMKLLPLLGEVSRWMPRMSKSRGECQQVVLKGDDVKLSGLPVLKCWPHDGGRFVTLPLVHTIDPETGARNVGMYRMQVMGEAETGMHWHMHKTGERHYRAYKKLGRRMPVSVCLGGDPAYTYSATAPLPDGIDEYILAGFLRRRSVKLVRCLTNELYVPADCDFVIEGYVDPSEEKVVEGPFGDHTGFYSLEDMYPKFHITAITHRRDAVYPATLVGVPPQEDLYIAKATEKIFLEPIRLAIQPEVRDLYMPGAGVAHNLAVVSIERTYPGQAFKVAASMWGAGQMMFNKVMLVTDGDARDVATLARSVRNMDVESDAMFARGVLDVLDHAAAVTGEGGKVALDLTAPRQERIIQVPAHVAAPRWAGHVDTSLTAEWGVVVVGCRPGEDIDMAGFADASGIEGANFFVATDSAARGLTPAELLWFSLANTDPGRDIAVSRGRMLIDARTKSPWRTGLPKRVPNVVTSSRETIELVDRRWAEYGIGEFIHSPSERYLPLVIGDGAAVSRPEQA